MAKPELLAHVKFGRLLRALSLRRYEAIGILESLWHHCWSCSDDAVGTADDVAWIVDWPAEDAARLADGLVAAGFLDADGTGAGFVVHDLWEHAPSYAKKRRARWPAPPVAEKVNHSSGSPFRTDPYRKKDSAAAPTAGDADAPPPAQLSLDDVEPEPEPEPGSDADRRVAPNVRVLARLCHEIAPVDRATWADAVDAVKSIAGRYHVPYDGRSVKAALTRVAFGRASPFGHLVRSG